MFVTGAPRETLRARLGALGFDEVRFARAGEANAGLRDWLDAGRHADMAWMERTAEKRRNPDLVLPGTRTVILLGVNYWSGENGGPVSRRAADGRETGPPLSPDQ